MPAQQCDPAVPLVANAATVADFIRAYTMVETVELSNLDSGGSRIDCERLNKALLDAWLYLESAKLLMQTVGKAVVDLNLNRWMLIIARYYLDTVRRRQDVTDDWKSVLVDIDRLKQLKGTVSLDNGQPGSQSNSPSLYNDNGKAAAFKASSAKYNSKTYGVL